MKTSFLLRQISVCSRQQLQPLTAAFWLTSVFIELQLAPDNPPPACATSTTSEDACTVADWRFKSVGELQWWILFTTVCCLGTVINSVFTYVPLFVLFTCSLFVQIQSAILSNKRIWMNEMSLKTFLRFYHGITTASRLSVRPSPISITRVHFEWMLTHEKWNYSYATGWFQISVDLR